MDADGRGNVLLLSVFRLVDEGVLALGLNATLLEFELERADGHFRGGRKHHFLSRKGDTRSG